MKPSRLVPTKTEALIAEFSNYFLTLELNGGVAARLERVKRDFLPLRPRGP
jgi:hypothetical protein